MFVVGAGCCVLCWPDAVARVVFGLMCVVLFVLCVAVVVMLCLSCV